MPPSAIQVLDLVDNLVGCLSTVCEDGNKLRDFPPDFSLAILKKLDTKLQLASSYVKTITNSYAPVNRIPVEVLNSILSLTIDRVPNFRPTLPRDPYYGTVQELEWPYQDFSLSTSVCRYWRTVAIQFAANWRTVQIFGRSGRQETASFAALCSKFASTCLSRASSTPLDVALYSKPSTSWWENNLLGEMHRFRLLVIDDVDVIPLLCHPAPLLESLTIEPTWRTGGRRPPATIPLLFAGEAPSLHYLSIRYFVPWPANTFTGLTHLCLQGDGTSPPYNFPQCLEFLASTPRLEELVFAFVEAFTRDESDRVITLRQLRRLAFHNCSQPVIARILSRLTLSPATVLAIRFQRHGGWRPDRELDYFACLPPDTARVVAPLALSRVCLVHDDAHWVRFVCSGAKDISGGGGAFDLYPGLVVGGLGRQVPTTNVVRLLAACPVTELWTSPVRAGSRLTIASRHPSMDEQIWRVLFGATPMLRRLVLGDWRRYGTDDDGCIPALSTGDLCPELTELFVIGDWSVKALCQLAKDRAEAGRPLKIVVFRRRPEHQPPSIDSPTVHHVEYRAFWEQVTDIGELAEVVGNVSFEEFEDFSASLPDVCFQERHAYWGNWRNQNTL